MIWRLRVGGNNATATFAESDATEAFAFAEAFHDDLIAVFEKASLFAGRKLKRLGPTPRQLEKTSALMLLFSANGPCRHHIARLQITSVRRMMCEHLTDRPVEIFCVRSRKQMRLDVLVSHLFGLDVDLEIDIEPAGISIAFAVEIFERLRIV